MSLSSQGKQKQSFDGSPYLETETCDPRLPLLIRELVDAWQTGQQANVEAILARNDDNEINSKIAIPLIYEELCLREEHGCDVDRETLLKRFPQWASHLELLLDCHDMVGRKSPLDSLAPGVRIGDFCLVSELGRGAIGRVFLATQQGLSDRLVVLKIAPNHGNDEYLALARLQHSGIVPVYAVHNFPELGLRVMCMPYLGGLTLSRAMQELKKRPLSQRTGSDFLAMLNLNSGLAQESSPTMGPALTFLEQASYRQAVCWIGASLADALHYAHVQGLLHLDVKPSNVLLANDGQPKLLDFHLAQDTLHLATYGVDWIGGTVGYMAPEQRIALDDIREGRHVDLKLDRKTDIYSLGVLLHELLDGCDSNDTDAVNSSSIKQAAEPAISKIIDGCMDPDPAFRYSNADELANDLRHCLVNYDTTLQSDFQKRCNGLKRPLCLIAFGIILITFSAVMLAQGVCVPRATICLWQARNNLAEHDYADAVEVSITGLTSIAWIPWAGELKQQLRDQQSDAFRSRSARQLNQLLDRVRFLDGLGEVPMDQLAKIESMCRRVWEGRQAFWSMLSNKATDDDIRTDILELVLLWTDLRLRLASAGEAEAVRHNGLSTLQESGRLFGVSTGLRLGIQRYANALGLKHVTADSDCLDARHDAPSSAKDFCSLGRSLLIEGNIGGADDAFRRSIELDPSKFWPNFYAAVSAYRRGHFRDAVVSFSVCIALKPASAEVWYNRGLAYAALGEFDRSQIDFARAEHLAVLPSPQ